MKKIIIPFFFVFYFLGLLNNNPLYSSLGSIFLLLAVSIIFSLVIFQRSFYYDKLTFMIMLIIFSYPLFFTPYYYFFYNTVNLKYFYLLFQIFLIFFVFILGRQLSLYKNYVCYGVLLLIFLLISFSLPFGKASIVGKENIYASLLLILLACILSSNLKKYIKYVTVFTVVCGIFISDARSSLVGLVLLLLLYAFSNQFVKIKNIIFVSVISFSLFWVFLIVHLYNTGKGDYYNIAMYDLTGKQLYSGREKMWGQFVDSILNSPVFGYGLGVDYGVIANVEYSTHNLYLAILLQQGFLGLFLFLTFMYFIYNKSIKNHTNQSRNFIFLIVPVMFLQQNFELSLTQNNLSIMLIFWLLLGLHSFSMQEKN
ncbi:O-antigen ligase family protein [Acinetobacter variabilis]|uniref:O-antigen ligase family protein n=1 Tax=Acinetobacter variabilis TaxID=70346 RepID=UPI002551272E|nr:O-antigen ligase family protein [Acinetobacter variabilis]